MYHSDLQIALIPTVCVQKKNLNEETEKKPNNHGLFFLKKLHNRELNRGIHVDFLKIIPTLFALGSLWRWKRKAGASLLSLQICSSSSLLLVYQAVSTELSLPGRSSTFKASLSTCCTDGKYDK